MYGINNNTGNIYAQFDNLNNNNNRFENSAENNKKQSEQAQNKLMNDAAKIAMAIMA